MNQQLPSSPDETDEDLLPDLDDDDEGRLWWGDYADDYVYVKLR